jgi:hypothetical protein
VSNWSQVRHPAGKITLTSASLAVVSQCRKPCQSTGLLLGALVLEVLRLGVDGLAAATAARMYTFSFSN